jgi:DNA-directed RNA polymerase subunit K/omega
MGAFHFVVLAALRAAQLTRGCQPKIAEAHVVAVMAQREIAEGKIVLIDRRDDGNGHIGDPDVT